MSYALDQRRKFLDMIDRIGDHWLQVFEQDEEFYSAAYWDLFTALWRSGRPMRKTDALGTMKGVRSPHTAGKYVDAALRHGLLVERDNPSDARSKLLELTPDLRKRMDAYFDKALGEVKQTAKRLEEA
ncbi:MAG: hypothetical protein R3316_04460 [Rhodovibrionaceae bacterium]|nr:hypothetical protein [Rhodovibrionaceae bacterium]